MNKKNITIALVAGLITGVLLIPILRNLEISFPYQNLGMIVVWPLLFVVGVLVGGLIGRRVLWFWQLTKFAEVGFLNTAIDFGVLNFLIWTSGISLGIYASLFKAVSFAVANINSYFWNKFWVFSDKKIGGGKEELAKEYMQFFIVSLVAIVINVGVFSFIVNFISAPAGLSEKIWANVGAAAGVASGLLWNFLGYKFIIFKK